MFFNYYAFGLHISSEIKLPGIIETTINNEPDIKIILGKVKYLLTTSEMENSFNYHLDHVDVYLWWENIGKVKLSNGNRIIVDLKHSNKNQIIPYLLGPVMAMLLHQRGFLVLHGSSVKINGRAIAFLGYSGLGKSTMAINFYMKGYPLITDDILAINFDKNGSPSVNPGYLHARLSKDSYDNIKENDNFLTPIHLIPEKVFCDTSKGFSPKKVKLKRIYFIENNKEMGISNLNPQKELIHLIKHSVTYWIFKENDQTKNFTQCANLVNNISFRHLKVLHSFKDIPEVINLIKKDLC